MTKTTFKTGLLAAVLLGAGCSSSVRREATLLDAAAGGVRTIAVLPVVYGYTYYTDMGGIGTDDPCYQGFFAIGFAIDALYEEAASAPPSVRILPREDVCRALGKAGFQGFPAKLGVLSLKKAVSQTSGLTVPLALQVGRELGADAVLLSAVSDSDTVSMRSESRFKDHMVARLVDVRSGKTLWAGRSAVEGSKFKEWAGGLKGQYHLSKRYRAHARSLYEALGTGRPSAEARGALVAVLPPDNESLDLQAPSAVVRMLASGLIEKGYLPLGGGAQDEALRALGITDGGQLRSVAPAKVAAALGVDALLYPSIGDFRTTGASTLSSNSVGLTATLTDAGGAVLWSSQGAKTGAGFSPMRSTLTEKMVGMPKLPELKAAVRRLLEQVPDWGR